jgi:general secretion pathway protein D
MEFTTGTETSMHIQAPDRGIDSTSPTETVGAPVASTHVVVEKP